MSDKKKKRQEEVIESSSEEAGRKSPVESSSEESPKARTKKTGDGKKKKAPGLKLESVEDGGANDPTTPRDVHDMELMAQASKTPRMMESVAKATPVAVPEAAAATSSNAADHAVEQTEEERKKIQPFPRIYFNVLEAKGVKPQNYFVSVAFDKEKDSWTTTTTKKKTIWEEKGRLLPIPEGAEKFRVTLYEKGLLDLTNSKIGEATWDVADLQDGYPHQPWAELQKKGKAKAQLRVQILYLPAKADIVGDEFVTPLHALINRDKYELLVRAVDDIFADLELLDADNRAPLHLAAQLDKPKYVKLLLQKIKGGADAILNPKKETALHTAGKYSGEDIVKQMLKAKMNVNATTSTQQTPLHYAAESNNVAAIKALTASDDCEINAKDKEGNTPLVVALMSGSADAVRELVKLKADLYTKNEKDLMVWEVAQRKDQVNTDPRKAFMEAVGTHDAREFLHRRTLNQKIVAKGAKCAMDYEASTQFAISVTETTEVAILITTDEVTTAPDFVSKSGFALVRSHQGEHNEPAISRDTIGFGGLKALALTLEPNFFYVVVPYCKQEDAARDYTLVVLHTKGKSVTVKQTKPWAHACVIESEWAGPTAGGAQPHRTWNENPQFEVTMPKKDDVKFCVVLSQEHNDPDLRYVDGDDHKRIPYDHNVGFYVLDRGAVKVLAQTDKWTNSRDVHQEFVMNFAERNHLTIIPAALSPGEEGPFTIKVYSDVAFSMDEK